MLKGVFRGALSLLEVVGVVVLGFALWILMTTVRTGAGSARALFDGVVRCGRVRASRRNRTTSFRGGGFGCTYAGAAPPVAALSDPPAPSRVHDGMCAYGGDRQPTPIAGLTDPPWDGP